MSRDGTHPAPVASRPRIGLRPPGMTEGDIVELMTKPEGPTA
jgi:hypothetical protein